MTIGQPSVRLWISELLRRIQESLAALRERGSGYWRKVDGDWRLAALVYLALWLQGAFFIHYAYDQNQANWIVLFGEIGPLAESTMLFVNTCVVWGMRHVLLDNRASKDRPEWRSVRHRGAFAFSFVAWFFIRFGPYMWFRTPYRAPDHWTYVWGLWFTACILAALTFEVCCAVAATYTMRNLRTAVTDYRKAATIIQYLKRDTFNLVWSLGTIGFFTVGVFGELFLGVTRKLCIGIIIAVVFISIIPWARTLSAIQEYVEQPIEELEKRVEACHSELRDLEHPTAEARSLVVARADAAERHLNYYNGLIGELSILSWWSDRKKDIVPVALLNFIPMLADLPGRVFGEGILALFS